MTRAEITPFYVMEMMRAAEARAAAGGEVLHLEVGQPSTGAPEVVAAELEAALRSTDPLGYTGAMGWEPLRRRIAAHYGERYGVEVDADRVAVTTGSSGGFLLAFLSAFEPGARVAVTEPGYPCYRNILAALGMDPVGVALGPETGWRLTPELIEAAGPLDGVVVASPSNPTGTTLDARALAALARHCRSRGIALISDEIYHGLEYTTAAATALAGGEDTFVVNSFSKYYSMTGWRLGWVIVPPAHREQFERLAQNLAICAPTPAQRAAIAAFEPAATAELDGHVKRYRHNRAVLLEELPKAGMTELAPADGAFYAYADVRGLTDDSMALCRAWLDELGVAATSGLDFDPRRGRGFVRFSFAGATADVVEAARRLARA